MLTFALNGRFGRTCCIILLLFFSVSCRSESQEEEATKVSSLILLLTQTATPKPVPTFTPTILRLQTNTPEVATIAPPETLPPATQAPPTLTATATETATAVPTLVPPTLTPSLTPVPLPTVVPADEVALRLLAGRNTEVRRVNHQQMLAQVRIVQPEIRSMVFQVNSSGTSGSIDCKIFHKTYQKLLNTGIHFDVRPELQLPNFYYNRAVERGIIELNVIEASCQADERWKFGRIPTEEFDPIVYQQLFTDANAVMEMMNESIAWLVGDVGRTRDLYQGVRSQIRQYGVLLQGELITDCAELSKLYESFSSAQRLLPPVEYRRPYQLYVGAVDSILETSSILNEQCRPFVSSGSGGQMPISAEALIEAKNGQIVSSFLIDESIRLLPVPTPAATLSPISAQTLRVSPSETEGFYEITLRIDLHNWVRAQQIRIGGFVALPSRVVTVQHTCTRDFYDHVEVTDADGETYRSPKYLIKRGSNC
ncbi:MAG: hypothetical protein ACPG8W_21555 [Candidatus Promineifilaceae bacterium]